MRWCIAAVGDGADIEDAFGHAADSTALDANGVLSADALARFCILELMTSSAHGVVGSCVASPFVDAP